MENNQISLDKQIDRRVLLNSNYNGIDLVKFICSLLVVIIHTAPFSSDLMPYGDYLNVFFTQYICRLAVPFFFVSSGFLLFNKLEIHNPNSDRIKIYIFRMLRHYGTWTILLFFGSKGQLWYVGASAVAVMIIFFLIKLRIRLSFVLVLSGIFYLFGVICSSYSFLFNPLQSFIGFNILIRFWQWLPVEFTSGICCGFIFLFLGALISNKKIFIEKKLSFILFLVSLLFLLAEVSLVCFVFKKTHTTMFVFHIPASIFLFCYVINIKLPDSIVYKKLRVISVLIFYLHNFVNSVIWFACSLVNKVVQFEGAIPVFVATLVMVSVISYFIEALSQKRRFGWLRYLYI